LYKTINRGTSWTKLTGNQFDRVTSLTFDPSNAGNAYLTTETQGLNFSSNMNNATPVFSLVNSYPFRQPERVFFNPYDSSKVWVTSFGNGMKVGDLGQAPNRVPVFAHEQKAILAYPNPATDVLYVSLRGFMVADDLLEVYDITGKRISVTALRGRTSISLDTRNWPAGTYLLSCKGYSGKVVKK